MYFNAEPLIVILLVKYLILNFAHSWILFGNNKTMCVA